MADLYETQSKEAKSEIPMLRNQLDGNDPYERKAACKRVVALMRAGENVQGLFSSMLRCVRTDDLELKKLTYLYLVNYSSQEPEQAIMAVNTFVQDSQDGSPLVRALAVRNMCRIRLESVAEHMIIPLRKCLQDRDPYVRKTAAFGVAKLYDVIPEAVENAKLFDDLLRLLHDENPMVVSNTAAAIFEINERRTAPIFELNADTVAPFLSAIVTCTEWCQIQLLDALAMYVPETADDANFLIDRLIPLLKNNNQAVVVGAFRCIFLYMDKSQREPAELFPLIIPPFITLVSGSEAEVQYVVLRTLSLFVQKYPKALSKQIRVFFCKYNEPSYVKMEKLDIVVTICTPGNAQLVLDELNEYCNAVDVAFVQKSIRCIGQIAIKMEPASNRCVDILVGLIAGKADYAIEEAMIVMCDIFRKYPGKFEGVLMPVCQNLEKIKEPRAKAAGIWVLGEYCHLIERADVLIDPFLETFHDEQPLVQLQILSSLVKMFLDKPDDTRDQIQCVLSEATKDGNAPDVKNRALVYWRLLSADSEAARSIVCFGKQSVVHSGVKFDSKVLDELIRNMGNVSGVLHVVPSDFVRRVRFVPDDDADYLDDNAVREWTQVRLNDNTNIDVYIDYDKSHIFLRIVNQSPEPIGQLAFAVNKNALGLAVSGAPDFPDSIAFGDSVEVAVPVVFNPSEAVVTEQSQLQLAFRTSAGTVYGLARLPVEFVTTEAGNITQDEFRANFGAYTASATTTVTAARIASEEHLRDRHVYVVGRNGPKTYVSLALFNNDRFLVELSQTPVGFGVSVKGSSEAYLPLVIESALYLFAEA